MRAPDMDTVCRVFVLYELRGVKVGWLALQYPYKPTFSNVRVEALNAIISKESLYQIGSWRVAANDEIYGVVSKPSAVDVMATYGITFMQIAIDGRPSVLLTYLTARG